jgi:quinol monooxygenase YgiN
MTSQITLHITIPLPPSSLNTYYTALKPVYDNLIQEPKCVYFNIFELVGQPGVVRLVEIWDADIEWMKEVSFCSVRNC